MAASSAQVPEDLRPRFGSDHDLYVYLHLEGVLSVVGADGLCSQRPAEAVRAAVAHAQALGGTVWISGPDSEPGLAALRRLLGDEPDPALLDVWASPGPPVQWGVAGRGSGLLAAAEFGQTEVLADALERGADPSSADDVGNTALHFAVHGKNLDAIEILLAAGADRHARNNDGITPLGLALLRADAGAVRLLADRDAVRFGTSHWILRALGFPLIALVGVGAVVSAVLGNVASAASLLGVALVLVAAGRWWAPTPETAEVVSLTHGGLVVQRSWRRREEISLDDTRSAALLGRSAYRFRIAIPTPSGATWRRKLGARLGGEPDELDTIDSWQTTVVGLTIDWVLRHDALPAIATRLVLGGAELTPELWSAVGDAVRLGGARVRTRRTATDGGRGGS